MGIWDDIKSTFKKGSSLTRLIYINIAVFLLLAIASIIGYLINSQDIADKLVKLLAVPSSLKSLIGRPWTLITYMFTHREILHILFNMLWLYWFGTIFLEFLDQKKLVAVYLLGGICGAVVYILSFNVFPVFDQMVSESIAIGASASVMAIVVSIAAYVPDYTVILFLIGRIKIKYIAIGIFILTSVLDFSVNTGGKLAHLGGALLGFIYTINLRKGRDLGSGINSVLDYFVTLFKPRKKFRVTYKKPVNDFEYNKAKAEHQQRINKILDKISKGGYDSLTKEEKELLFKEGQKKN
jgi:membrane associated rhomboid family serine protease